jgi:hypothetical protein
MAIELIRQRLTQTLFAQTPYKVGGLALVVSRHDPRPDGPMHQDKYTGSHVYQMPDPAEDVPGGLRWLISLGAHRSMAYSRRVGGVLVPMQLPDGCATAQVVGQSARAAGAPRYEGGPRGDLYHGRINPRRVHGPRPPIPATAQYPPAHPPQWSQTQTPLRPAPAVDFAGLRESEGGERGDLLHGRINGAAGLEVIVRLGVRLPALGAVRDTLEVPSLKGNYAYRLFHTTGAFQDVGRGTRRRAAEKVSEQERFSKLHCGHCMKALNSAINIKALNKGAWYWVCAMCGMELRTCGVEEMDDWLCPTAAEGMSGCLCCCTPKQQSQGARGARSSSRRPRKESRIETSISEVRLRGAGAGASA